MEIHLLPSRPATDMLEAAVRSDTGNPLPSYGVRQMAGGSKRRMFNKLKADGYFNDDDSITSLGKLAFLLSASRQRIDVGFRTVKRMILYPAVVNDDTCRCIQCGQIDEEPYHQRYVCEAAFDVQRQLHLDRQKVA